MNDFTKEELENIIYIINDIHKCSQAHGLEGDFDLRDKVQCMIDDYCEHVNDNRFNAMPAPGNIKMCVKCEQFYL